MAKGKDQSVIPYDDGWAVKGDGNIKVTKKTQTKNEAIDYGKQIAKNQQSELTIFRKDGTIQSKDSYGNDPNPPKDTEH